MSDEKQRRGAVLQFGGRPLLYGINCRRMAWATACVRLRTPSLSLSQQTRALLTLAASLVAIRLQKVTHLSPDRLGRGAALTHRELAVLRHVNAAMLVCDRVQSFDDLARGAHPLDGRREVEDGLS